MSVFSNLRFGPGAKAVRGPRLTAAVRGGQLRLAVFSEGQIAWHRVMPLNPAYLEGGVVAQPRAVAEALRSALEQCPVEGVTNGVASVAGYHALVSLIDIPASREFPADEIIPREARRQFSYRPDSSSLTWWPLDGPEGMRRYVFVVTRRAALHALQDLFTQAGLHLDAVDSDPLAIARAANIDEGVVVQAEPDGGDVIVIKNGTLGMVRSAFWGGDIVDQESLSARIVDLADRTIAAHNQENVDGPLASTAPLLLCGAGADLLGTQVAETLGRAPGAFDLPIESDDGFAVNELASNLGMSLRWVK